MQWIRSILSAGAILLALAATAPAVTARSKQGSPEPKDEIAVVAHIPLANGPVLRFFITQHHSSYFLYAEREAGRGVALIDITNAGAPAVLSDGDNASLPGNLAVVAGTAALVTSAPAVSAAAAAETIRVVDLSNPQKPRVAREFAGVTAMTRDDRRGLVFVANGEGVWILKQQLAIDPQIEKDYANYVLYSH